VSPREHLLCLLGWHEWMIHTPRQGGFVLVCTRCDVVRKPALGSPRRMAIEEMERAGREVAS
jgi:hypothetical protein